MYLNKKEIDAMHGAIDFIASNADGAEDITIYNEMMEGLGSVLRKAAKQYRPSKQKIRRMALEILKNDPTYNHL